MLACQGAAQFNDLLEQFGRGLLHTLHFIRIGAIDTDAGVEIPVARMSHCRHLKIVFLAYIGDCPEHVRNL